MSQRPPERAVPAMEIAQSLASRRDRRTLSHVEFLSFLTRMGFGNQLGWSGPNRLAQRHIWRELRSAAWLID
jgi:hypothetical protein